MRPLIEFQHVGMRYGGGPEILKDVSLRVLPRSFTYITGASGAGKSTLLRLMYLDRRPSRGFISLFDRDVATVPRRETPDLRRRIGVVFQDFRLLSHLSALENVALPLRIAGLDETAIRTHVTELLRWVGLGRRMEARPSFLSGGEQQRTAIARAVIARPDLLLADEPTGNVDEATALRLMRLLDEVNRLGTTVIIATHNDALIRKYPHPVLRLEDGRIDPAEAG